MVKFNKNLIIKYLTIIKEYEVFKNDEQQSHVGRCESFTQAKQLCEKNECFENALIF